MVNDKGLRPVKRHLTKGLLESSHNTFLVLTGTGKPVIHIVKVPALSLTVRADFRELSAAISNSHNAH